ncbi:polyphenol oxidase family protein [Candidatus Neptunochlamydia vexilliferae]|uniref:Laccase domain protein n=1 Tax=Candidatus Neptunichlamydia vexilliferae TaxID=1651774 RepID=A0ABS0B2Q6_9BACT|nr:polyphenol oxidase family protein [Candidatus Neptunochlamydia vexilliferae]MBF5059845.1 Laccase domain protein [Candidatus Neptunochlamydia vexilliferae]
MRRKKKNGIEWLEFELLQKFPEVRHGVFGLGEEKNIPAAFDALGIEKGVKLKQCHRADILEVKRYDIPLTHIENYDGMVTKEKEMGLLIRHADCQAAIFYDPIAKVLGTAHSGWRGSVQNIYQNTIDAMVSLGADPAHLIVCIGPSLGSDNAEFKHYREELPQAFWRFQVRPTYFDFWKISTMQLMTAGVPQGQIEIAEICTYDDPSCYSYRRDKTHLRHGTIAAQM